MKKPSKIESISSQLFVEPQHRFINRELSWLAFNLRVLEEAGNVNNPLLERVQFLSISASNLDEFYMVRVAGLKDQLRSGMKKRSDDGLNAEEQLDQIYELTEELMDRQQSCWKSLQPALDAHGVHIQPITDLGDKDLEWLRTYFREEIFPVITPIAIDPAHPFPFLPNLGKALVVNMRSAQKREITAVISLPPKLKRFVKLSTKRGDNRFVRLEDIIMEYIDSLFPGATIHAHGMISVIRDSDLDIEEEAEDLVGIFEKAVKRRRRGRVIRMKATTNMPAHMVDFVAKQLDVDEEEVIRADVLGLTSLKELSACDLSDLKFQPFTPRFPERISDFGGDCFAAIKAKDIIVHHPYESFDVVVQFLRQAAADPNVMAIKQTLYRTSNESPIVKALIEAAEAGKSVTVVVELKARFDEEANIRWARDLERAGAQVVFGFVDYKTHAKISLVMRREEKKIRSYVHFGTGNYHSITAKMYTDLSYFTCDTALCYEATRVFNYLTGYAPPRQFRQMVMSPINLRRELMELIDAETKHAIAGKPAQIWAKMNSLTDPQIIDALYCASQEGVSIDLVVRGICCLRPQMSGLSENIRVKSIVGRFLEHSRIFCFGNGHGLPSAKAKVYISSADWMQRNLNARVEVMVPLRNSTVHEQVLEQIMVANIRDERQTWILHPDGHYARLSTDAKAFCAHDYFLNNPSLSGRGKALRTGTAPPEIPMTETINMTASET